MAKISSLAKPREAINSDIRGTLGALPHLCAHLWAIGVYFSSLFGASDLAVTWVVFVARDRFL
jgi:hypothetical protein